MRSIGVLASMTFREAIRRRIVLTGLLLGAAFIVIYSIGFHFIIGQVHFVEQQALTDPSRQTLANIARTEASNTLLLAGLYAVTFLCVAMAALLAADTLAGDISSGTIQTVITKPIRRSDVIVGKWLGFAFLLGVYFLLMGGGTVLSVYIQSGYAPNNLLAGLLLIYMEALLIMTISMACSSGLSALATGAIVFGMYGLAFIGGWIEQIGAVLQNSTAVKVGIIASLISPSESLWRRAAYEMQTPLASVLDASPFGTVSVPSPLMIAYSVLYMCFAFYIAVRVFQKRDI
ncbi:MAG TPA: ABC transporter permease subunit [Anaerolineales bacterium]|nr:ABC transporter permease subunit [Anaerolineales bacterium]